MGFENLNGLSFGDAKSEVRNAYKNEGRTCAGVQAWFATVGQVMGIGYNSVREALANGSVVGDTIMLRGCKTHDVIEIESGNSATSKEISGVSAKAVWMNPSKSSIYYGSSGYPKDLRRAKQMALGFASKMRDLHASGKVHGGVGSDSLVLDQTGGVHIGRSDSLRNTGESAFLENAVEDGRTGKLLKFRRNCGPEFAEKYRKFEKVFFEMRKLGYEPPPAIMPATIDQINKEREERKGQLEDQKTQLISELRSFKVTPSYDIYAEGTVLLGLFFGKKGNAFSKRFEDGRFLEETKGMGLEERTNYFKEALTRLNNDMRTATRQGYSETEIQKMSELMAWMMDPEPTHRPTSEQVFTYLMELGGTLT